MISVLLYFRDDFFYSLKNEISSFIFDKEGQSNILSTIINELPKFSNNNGLEVYLVDQIKLAMNMASTNLLVST